MSALSRLAIAAGSIALVASLAACRCSMNADTPGASAPTTRTPSYDPPPADALIRPNNRAVGIRRTMPGISPRVLEAMQQSLDAGVADGT
ncbi:MAG: hypothetical protein WCJ30_24485 [Deltaproteobacteria bacterium]